MRLKLTIQGIGLGISRRVKWVGHARVSRVGEKRDAYRVFVGKPEGNIRCERRNHTWEGTIET
jgi:hypothetical protein